MNTLARITTVTARKVCYLILSMPVCASNLAEELPTEEATTGTTVAVLLDEQTTNQMHDDTTKV